MGGRIMPEETFPVTIFYSDVKELERAVLVNGLGLLRSIRHSEIVPDEAEGLLFGPGMHSVLERRGVSGQVLDFIARGFFFDDVLLIAGEDKLQRMVDDMEALALTLLLGRPLDRRYAWALPTKPKDQP